MKIYRPGNLEYFIIDDTNKSSYPVVIYVVPQIEIYHWIGGEVAECYVRPRYLIAPLTFLLLTGHSVESILEKGKEMNEGEEKRWEEL